MIEDAFKKLITPRQFKLVIAPDVDYLELRVNAFLANPENKFFEPLGPPQVFNHEEYVQTFYKAEGT